MACSAGGCALSLQKSTLQTVRTTVIHRVAAAAAAAAAARITAV